MNNKFFKYSLNKDLISVRANKITLTYFQLFENASIIAEHLNQNKITPKSYVPILLDNNETSIEIILAVWQLGAVPVPFNTRLLPEEINSILSDYNFSFIITDKKSYKYLDQLYTHIILLDELKSKISYSDSVIETIDSYEAVVIFTSGSTGRSKGIVHTFSSLINSIENGNKILNHVPTDRWLASLPFYHIGGFQIICRSLYHGCSIIIPESLQTNDLAEAIKNHKPTHISLVSTQLERLINKNVKPDELLRVSLIGGGFIDDDLIFEADKLGWKPCRVYGSSETASMITSVSSDEMKYKPQSVGKPFDNVELKFSNESEILIKSNSLFKNYLNDKEETSTKLINGFYYTGDLGSFDNDGYLFIEARRNDLIVTGGENVNPIEVENALLELSFIKDACVFPKQSKTWGQIIAAAIVCDDLSIDEKFLKEILKQKLAGYKIPKEFYFVDELPRTSLGKLEREKIRKMF